MAVGNGLKSSPGIGNFANYKKYLAQEAITVYKKIGGKLPVYLRNEAYDITGKVVEGSFQY